MNKGLHYDSRPQSQPADTYPFAKNGIVNDLTRVVENEPGFLPSSASIPYRSIGIISTPKHPVVISSDGTNTAFGYFDSQNDTYVSIFNDSALGWKLGLDPAFYVRGESQTNHLGEVVIAFTNKDAVPMYLNCDNPQVTAAEDFRLFPLANFPDMEINQDTGGGLFPGAYYVAARYIKKDGTQTPYLAVSDVQIIAGNATQATDKALRIELSNCDTRYQYVTLAIISKIGGITKVVELEKQAFGSSGLLKAVYTGGNFSTDITLEEVLVQPAVYSKVKAMGQLNDELYLGNLEIMPDVDMQQHALLVNVEWVSELVDVNPPSQDILTGKKRGHPHEEVLAVYIQYSLTEGGWSKAFVIPGPSPQAGDEATSTEASLQGITAKKYQVEDTIPYVNVAAKTGGCGVWINDNESYPNTAEFDATSLGGRNLKNQKVLHHRMPSIRYCKANLYPFDTTYGKSKLDMLGLRVSNVIIPPQYTDRINGYRILYAKRTLGNSTFIGQSLLMQPGRKGDPNTDTINSPDTDYISTGGNWNSKVEFRHLRDHTPIIIDRNLFRFHSFDMLFSRPSVSPTYLSFQLRHQIDGIGYLLLEDHAITPGAENGPTVYLCDYLARGNTPTVAGSGKKIRKVSETQYIPNNLNTGKWKNQQQETAFGGKISNPVLETADISYHRETVDNTQEASMSANKEVTYLCNLMHLRTDLYLPFNSQSLAVAGYKRGTDATVFFGGDTFVGDYCFHTYGWSDALNRGYGGNIGATKVVRRFVCESASNINARFETVGNPYSKWYPKFPLIQEEPTNYITNFQRDQDPNQFGYSKDLNTLNDLISVRIFDPEIDEITSFPYRIHRGGKASRQTDLRNWRTFLALDYYECQKNMGAILNIEGMEDRLLIHHERSLFLTQDKAKLQSGLLSVTLGAGDIFQFQPQEKMPAKLGWAGTQHDLACVRTPAGYVFIDSLSGQVFIYKGDLRLMNEGLDTFFREFLRLKETNVLLGNGYTIGYDPVYKRILLTSKNLKTASGLTGKLYYTFEPTEDFINELEVGDLVYMHGRWTKFLGVNATEHSCQEPEAPVLDDKTFELSENSLEGVQVGVLTGTSVAAVYFVSGNTNNAFRIAGNELIVNNPTAIDFETTPVFNLVLRGYATNGLYDDANVTVNLVDIEGEAPVTGQFAFAIPENAPVTTVVGFVEAQDSLDLPLTYAITAGNDLGIFAINASTGEIRILDNENLNHETYPKHILTVIVSNGEVPSEATVEIEVTNVPEAPVQEDETIQIYDTVEDADVIHQLTTFGETTITYQEASSTAPGLFTVNPDGSVVINDASALNALTTPVYTLEIVAKDGLGNSTLFKLIINVLFDPGTIEFRPAGASCAGSTKSWSQVELYSTKLSATITTVSNIPGQTFQDIIDIPVYYEVEDHIDCGGAVQHYVNVLKSGIAVKDDCETGSGEIVTYYVQAGKYMSIVSQAAADAEAEEDVEANKQLFANDNGNCL